MKPKRTVTVPYETVTVINGTEYVVHTHFSEDSDETICDKVKRLILNNIGSITDSKVA